MGGKVFFMIKVVKRFVLKLAFIILNIKNKIFRPKSLGVRLMLFNKKGEVLLIKHSYRPGYYFPGGGVNKGELLYEAATRELWEETGLQVKNWELFGVYRYFEESKDDTIIVLASHTIVDERDLKIDELEIIEAGWYHIDALPAGITPHHVLRIQELKEGQFPIIGSW